MRNEDEIVQELARARADYHEAVQEETIAELAERSGRIKELMAELSATLSRGAMDCPDCGQPPHGMLKTPGAKMVRAPVYVVGCLACPRAARGNSPEQAVKRWNEEAR